MAEKLQTNRKFIHSVVSSASVGVFASCLNSGNVLSFSMIIKVIIVEGPEPVSGQ